MDWIRTLDKLPTVGERVLISILHQYSNAAWRFSITLSIFEKDGRWGARDNENNSYTTPDYWMPLPAPPELTDKQRKESSNSSASGYKERVGRKIKELREAVEPGEM
jgi:hypothetical protein